MIADGFTVTVTVKAVPVHVPDVGVTLYVAVSATAAVLVRLSFTVLCPVCAPALPERAACIAGVDQAYVVPVGMIVPVGV